MYLQLVNQGRNTKKKQKKQSKNARHNANRKKRKQAILPDVHARCGYDILKNKEKDDEFERYKIFEAEVCCDLCFAQSQSGNTECTGETESERINNMVQHYLLHKCVINTEIFGTYV